MAKTTASLSASWDISESKVEPLESRRNERWRARYLITQSGRLLYAAMIGNKWQWWSHGPDQSAENYGSGHQELRLTHACDGPTLPPTTSTTSL